MAIKTAKLNANSQWVQLRKIFDERGEIEAVTSVLDAVRELGAVSVLWEEDYLDQDFTAEFAAFYSRVFKRYAKACRRFHFFSVDITPTLAQADDPQKISKALRTLSDTGSYLGFIVQRPVKHAPLGRVVLKCPPAPKDTECELLVRSNFEVHVLGATLQVEGAPYMQQDSRIATCAQACIWMAGRHFHSRHRGPWFSTVEVHEAATRVTDSMLSQSLPAGSGGLAIDHMVRALKDMGRQPLAYVFAGGAQWEMKPHTIIHRYIDSGIPVIIGLSRWKEDMPEGAHAAVATGVVRRKISEKSKMPDAPTRAEYVDYFLVNDDQRGTNLRLPLNSRSKLAQTPYSLDNAVFVVVPLPGKVFMPAEIAEELAWDMLGSYRESWKSFEAENRAQLGSSIPLGNELCKALRQNKVIARTYLTYGWRYKQRILNNVCNPVFKRSIIQHDLPRYVWVTEFGTVNSFNKLSDDDARIYSHAVIDATSSIYWEAGCAFHAPGYSSIWHSDKSKPDGPYDRAVRVCPNDELYKIKVRGKVASETEALQN